jgi:hypothetical protein
MQHDMVIDNGPGLAVRTDINAAIQALVSMNAGSVEPTTTYAGMLWLDTSVPPDGQLRQRNQTNTAWVAPALTSTFPAADLSFFAKTGPNRFVWNDKADGTGSDIMTLDETGSLKVLGTPVQAVTAERYNRVVNGAMQHSQENGNTNSGALASHGGYYPADQWPVVWSVSPGTVAAARVVSGYNTPNGSANVINTGCGTAKTALAAGDYWLVRHTIEGSRLADLGWGAAGAKPIVIRFWVQASFTGKFSVSLQNSAINRVYVHTFDITTANVWQAVTFTVPGDTTGMWLKDTGVGLYLNITFAVGSTYAGNILDAWQAGNFFGASIANNGMATASNSFLIGDVGLYLDPDNTGLAPRWQTPDYASELAACKRYWQQLPNVMLDVSTQALSYIYPIQMRVTPAFSGGGAGYSQGNPSNILFTPFQTTRGYQTLVLNARM